MECDPNQEDLHEQLEVALYIGSIHEVLIRDGTYLKLEFDDLSEDGKALFRQTEDLYGKGRVRIETATDICEDCGSDS